MNRLTDMTENINFPQTTYAAVNTTGRRHTVNISRSALLLATARLKMAKSETYKSNQKHVLVKKNC